MIYLPCKPLLTAQGLKKIAIIHEIARKSSKSQLLLPCSIKKKIATKTLSHKGKQRKFIKIPGVLVPWWQKT
jgi:hypothetical protein